MSLLKLYSSFPLKIDYAQKSQIFDKNGRVYIDTFSGIGALPFGHSHPELINTMKRKMERYTHLSNFISDDDAVYVAQKLVRFTGQKGLVYFSNSGAEAVEAALKLIRKISTNKKNKIVYFSGAFHGRTLGALSINGIKKQREPFLPLLSDTVELPFNDTKRFNTYMEEHAKSTIAVVLEAVQGAGGIKPLNSEFANAIRDWKQRYNFLLVCDEVQAGMGRTGKMFSYRHFSLLPNLITVAKALGGGLPLGALIMLEPYTDVFKPGEHGSTFAPNPVSLAGARYVVDNLPALLDDVVIKGDYFKKRLKGMKSDRIADIRGIGLMLAVELRQSSPALADIAFENGLLINIIQGKIIRLLPALNISRKMIDNMVEKLEYILGTLQ